MHELFSQRRYLIPFRGLLLPQIFTDTLVIGSGAAGLRAGIEASAHGDVIVLAKSADGTSASAWAQGGIAGAITGEDTVEAHIRDTLQAGAGLCDEEVVRRIIAAGPERVRELLGWGCRFDRDETGTLQLAREGGHSAARIARADGDATGREIQRTLWQKARSARAVRVFGDCFALDLLTAPGDDGSACMGAITHHPRYGLQMIWARATIVASGGCGELWRETTNPPGSAGDGLAMAYRAGADLADMAFMQFHPTTLYIAGASRTLISEAVRGEGATLVDRSGARIMEGVHELGDLAPRDVVSKAIARCLRQSGDTSVFLDARGVDGFAARFPQIAERLAGFELDASRDLIPVRPAAHYMIGGVRTDEVGRTNIPGLYAAGEAAATGLHGANRLASNSLLEALATGEAAGRTCEEMRAPGNAWGVAPRSAPVGINSQIPLPARGELDVEDVRTSLRSVMWRHVGLVRTGEELGDVCEMIDFWARYTLDKVFDDRRGWETQNMLLVGACVVRSAQWREESRGCHERGDFPGERDAFAAHDLWRRGEAEARTEAVAAAAV